MPNTLFTTKRKRSSILVNMNYRMSDINHLFKDIDASCLLI